MSQKYDIFKLDYFLQRIDLKKYDICLINELMSYLIPKDTNGRRLVSYNVDVSDEKIYFIPEERRIEVPINRLYEWAYDNSNVCKSYYGLGDGLEIYLLLFSILHEVEHSYQFLIGEGAIDAKCDTLQKVYSEIMGYMINSKFKTFISKYRRYKVLKKYDKNHDLFFIERNANLEASSTILQLALLNEDSKAIEFFKLLLSEYICQGYFDNNKGCIYQTYKSVGLINNYNSYNKVNLRDEEKIKYGFEISEDKRLELLEKRALVKRFLKR